MTTDLRKLNMKNKSKREKSEWFSVCNSGMHDRTWGNPLSNIKPLGSKRAWWLFLEVVVGARGAQHSECDVWQWGIGVQRTPLAINHDYKGYYKGGAAVTSAFSCDICWQSTWGAVRTTMHQRDLPKQQFSSVEYYICETYKNHQSPEKTTKEKNGVTIHSGLGRTLQWMCSFI